MASQLQKPRSILCISAHWLKEGTAVTGMENPKTIHDFYGFPEALYRMEYGARGSPELAGEVARLVKAAKVRIDGEWGLDHGTWSVLAQMYPEAEIPVVQLSLDYYLPLEKQYAIGKELAPLREKGVLIIGSGNLVHNLMAMRPGARPFSWAADFDGFVEKSLLARDDASLIGYSRQKSAQLAHPTYDHYLPLLYAMGASAGEKPQFFNRGIFAGSVGMRSAVFGAEKLSI